MIPLVVVAVGLVVLVLVGLSLLSHVRRFGRARAALRTTVTQRVATLRALRGSRRARPGRARHPSA